MKQRIITAILLMLVTIPCVIIGGYAFKLLCLIASLLGIYELLKIMHCQPWHLILDIVVYLFAFYIIFIDKSLFFVSTHIIMLFAVLLFTLSMFLECLDIGKINHLLGFVVFTCIAMHCILQIRLEYGVIALLYIAFATYGSDTGAYFAGVTFGKHKLIPRLSPKKTIEGSIGGIILGTILASLLAYFYPLNMSFIQSVILAFILTITAQIGDLTFSSLKRYVGIKDFSNLLPGHGGVLDRIDSLLFNSLVFALYFTFFIL